MKRIFTILAFITLTAVSSFGQNYDDEIITDTVEYYITEEDIKEAPFEIEGGMVYSRGIIKVYDIRGRLVAMRPQSFNVNTLKYTAKVYIIVAEEGVIKFNGAYTVYTAEERDRDFNYYHTYGTHLYERKPLK